MAAESTPRRVGPFQLEGKLGVGGMGVVYKATYLKTGQKVALKMLAPDLTADPKVAQRFEREMEILQRLKHPNIIRYYGGSTTGSQRWYAMELVPGGSLDKIIKDKGRLAWEDALNYGIQVAKALEHAHAAGIIHRDLKPANLLITGSNTLKLTDFGIARDTEATALTQAGKTVGTMAYMAPEQITGKHPIGRKTDLYSLGCVLFEMLTGKTPFDSKTTPEILFKHLDEDPPSVREIAWETPIWFEELIEELLAKDPNERPFDALAVQVKLEEVRQKVADKKTIVGETKGAKSGLTVQGGAVVTKSLSKKKAKRKDAKGPVWERGWFLAICLAAVVGGVAWGVWPASEKELFAKVQKTVLDGGEDGLLNADLDLERLKSRFPNGAHAAQVQEWLDDVDAIRAERKLAKRMTLGNDPDTEGGRLWVAGKQYEKFGDRATALEKYDAMQTILAKSEEDRPFRNLARRQAKLIRDELGGKSDRVAFINGKLAEADEMFLKGEKLAAEEQWKRIDKLYGSLPEFSQQVTQARDRLDNAEKTLKRNAEASR